jgi:hypothetical protein
MQINVTQPITIEDQFYELPFCINKLINTNDYRVFVTNSRIGVALKIQNWEEEIMLTNPKAEILQITLIDYRNYEEYYEEEEYQDGNLCYWVRFSIKLIHTFHVRKSLNYCKSNFSRIIEELNQKWIFYKKNYFRGTRGITKGIISWKTIEKEVYDREFAQNEIEVIDEEQLFEMEMGQFYKMQNIQKGKKMPRKK